MGFLDDMDDPSSQFTVKYGCLVPASLLLALGFIVTGLRLFSWGDSRGWIPLGLGAWWIWYVVVRPVVRKYR